MTTLAAAQSVFHEALNQVLQVKPDDPFYQQWNIKRYSLEDIAKDVQQAASVYTSDSHRKAGKWLAKLSEKVMLYSPIMDVFAQMDPQYACLAWGTTKLLLTVCNLIWLFELWFNKQ